MAAEWSSDTWDAEAGDWIRHALVSAGLPVPRSIERVRVWALSCVLKAVTSSGTFYFKAVPPVFAREPSVTEALGRLFPGQVPQTVAIDPPRGYMLVRDMEGESLDDEDLGGLEAAVAEVVALQQGSAAHVSALEAAGCADRRPETMPVAFESMLAADPLGLLTGSQHEALERRFPLLSRNCEELRDADIPAALVHGDLHFGNVVQRGDDIVVFDWTDACISHPFFELGPLLYRKLPPLIQRHRDHLLARYLDGWRAWSRDVDQIATLSRPLISLFQVLTYWRLAEAVPDGPDAEGMRRMLTFWVDDLLTAGERR